MQDDNFFYKEATLVLNEISDFNSLNLLKDVEIIAFYFHSIDDFAKLPPAKSGTVVSNTKLNASFLNLVDEKGQPILNDLSIQGIRAVNSSDLHWYFLNKPVRISQSKSNIKFAQGSALDANEYFMVSFQYREQ